MNPQTDLSTQVRLSSGHIVEVIQPGGRLVRSKNWRLNETAFRNYEAHIRLAIDEWPRETPFVIPNGMSPNTFEHRLRDALQALKLFGYDAQLQQKLLAIREELMVSMDQEGKQVWIRAKGKQGRPVQIHKGEHQRPGMTYSAVHPNPDAETLQALCVLASKGVRTEPVRFKGKITGELQAALELQFDTAFVYDEQADVTTML